MLGTGCGNVEDSVRVQVPLFIAFEAGRRYHWIQCQHEFYEARFVCRASLEMYSIVQLPKIYCVNSFKTKHIHLNGSKLEE